MYKEGQKEKMMRRDEWQQPIPQTLLGVVQSDNNERIGGRLIYVENHQRHPACSFSLLSAARTAATEGGKCIKLPFGFSSVCGVNMASRSFSVKRGWS